MSEWTRETSIAAWNYLVNEGLLSKRRAEVLFALSRYHAPGMPAPKPDDPPPRCTANELYRFMRSMYDFQNMNVVTRLGELRDMGLVREAGERECSVTGMVVLLWEIIPDPIFKPHVKKDEPTRRELIEALCQQLEEIFVRIKPETDKGKIWVNRTKALLQQCEKYRKQKRKLNEAN